MQAEDYVDIETFDSLLSLEEKQVSSSHSITPEKHSDGQVNLTVFSRTDSTSFCLACHFKVSHHHAHNK